ncbi:MAG: Fic family protein [Marinobacterium sp.]|nr:Fic family protein [Marinobacterium sp.]
MSSEHVGYAYLSELNGVKAITPDVRSRVMPVSRKERIGDVLAIPRSLQPEANILSHVLYALKHEGINLQILAQVLPLIDETAMREEFESSPTGKYLRAACFLWEHFTEQTINRTTNLQQGNYHPLFNPDQYITTKGYRDKRWRIIFNGLGSLDYCITVKRTEHLQEGLSKDILARTQAFTDSLSPEMLNRTLSWAYLSETRDSFAIEKEIPDAGRVHRFTNLLRQAHRARSIDEDYLTDLQNATINNKFDWAAAFRHEQNYLSNGTGAIGITYIPPEPELCRELMEHWMTFANALPNDVDPLILGAIISFGFVFLHPFMDGNGRLSRFMFHHVLCQRGSLANGLILPVSAVLKDQEREYLEALTDFSEKARAFWDVTYIDIDNIHFSFEGCDAIYRYWDGTACAELMVNASEEAMEQHIRKEVAYLSQYDALKRRIDREYDIADKTLSKLIMFCLSQNGRISKNRRTQHQYDVQAEVFDAIEQAYVELFNNQPKHKQDTDD